MFLSGTSFIAWISSKTNTNTIEDVNDSAVSVTVESRDSDSRFDGVLGPSECSRGCIQQNIRTSSRWQRPAAVASGRTWLKSWFNFRLWPHLFPLYFLFVSLCLCNVSVWRRHKGPLSCRMSSKCQPVSASIILQFPEAIPPTRRILHLSFWGLSWIPPLIFSSQSGVKKLEEKYIWKDCTKRKRDEKLLKRRRKKRHQAWQKVTFFLRLQQTETFWI